MPKKYPKKTQPKRKWAWVWVSLGAVLVTVLGIIVLSHQPVPPADTSATQAVASLKISVAEAFARYQQGVFILDVRTQAEYDQFHIHGSILIPLDELEDRISELPDDQVILVVCRSGHRSESAAALLKKAGFSQVVSLDGGLQAWTGAGYAVDGTAP